MLNNNIHESHLRQLIAKIFNDSILQKQLAFKGGTCLYFFYGLDRFSTDLDFNCTGESLDYQRLNQILEGYEILEHTNKFNTWFWLLSYGKMTVKIKIEVSKRDYPDKYEIKDLLGVKLPVMTKECMFAHKLCAITDRKILQNRDLYDTLFMLNKDFEIDDEIIELRTKKSTKEYLEYLLEFIPKKAKPKNILDGLGEVLSEKQKNYYRQFLIRDLIFAIQNRLLSFEK
jgi:predicted nucleotidyltransferase component of viral defense system